jgi:hypothetical protein
MNDLQHLNQAQLEAGIDIIKQSPTDNGTLELISIRPEENERTILEKGTLDTKLGVVGDNWINRRSSRTTDGSPHPDMQINIMNARAAQLVAQAKERWALAGDQLYIDMDLSTKNLPAGSQIQIGDTILEITDQPHTGCKKFVKRFGLDAMKFVNSEIGRAYNLRGINAKVVKGGTIHSGDSVVKL